MMNVRERITQLEQALQRLGLAKKQLCRNTTEAKSRIQSDMSRQLEALRNREVWLLTQLDVVSGAKEEVLQQQTARLNKTLGRLQSGRYTGDGDGMYLQVDRFDIADLRPEETPYVCFKSDPASLRDAITRYGKIDANTVTPLHSPYMTPDYPAPSLPRHFEDYDDAEHHILYKTVEEINRMKTEQACVYVNIPKLSTRAEDWLLHPGFSSTSTTDAEPQFTFPRLCSDITHWLQQRTRSRMSIDSGDGRPGDLPRLERMSTDASINTWLHKIKQNPYEEEDEYDFIEEISGDTKTHASGDPQLEQFSERTDTNSMWLAGSSGARIPSVKASELALDKWLLKAESRADTGDVLTLDLSRYFTDIGDELHIWLLHGSRGPPRAAEGGEYLRGRVGDGRGLRGPSHNPWLLRSRSTSHPRLSSQSPEASRRSLHSSLNSLYSDPGVKNKWLLTSQAATPPTMYTPCRTMEKYFDETKQLSWLRSGVTSSTGLHSNYNPLETYISHNQGGDNSGWLAAMPSCVDIDTVPSPLEVYIQRNQLATPDHWLLPGNQASEGLSSGQSCSDLHTHLPEGDNVVWLMPTRSADGATDYDLCTDDIC